MKKKLLFVAVIIVSLLFVSCDPGSNTDIQSWKANTGIILNINNDDLIVEMKGQESTYGRIDRPITEGGTYMIVFEIGGQFFGGYFDVSTNLKTAVMGGVYYQRIK